MFVSFWEINSRFRSNLSYKCFCWFTAAMLVPIWIGTDMASPVQSSINLGKIFPPKISHMKNFTDLNLGECLSFTKYNFHELDGNMGLPFQLAQAIQDFKRLVPCVSADDPPCTFRVLWGCLYDQCRKLRTRSSRDRYMMVTKRTCGSFLLKVEECVHQRTRQGVIMLRGYY